VQKKRKRFRKTIISRQQGKLTSPREEEMERLFRKFYVNDDRILRSELAALFESMGHAASEDEIECMMAEADADDFIILDDFVVLNATVTGDVATVEEDMCCMHSIVG
jgi:calcium-binding protein CML